uniref:Tachykinin-like peptide-III n=1 Tax=Phoneutria nigriventer TaxID=6918 RepID=TLP3_PHONI|nr:RecName: Full=Tachykinin-like peptide-III; AltName: Full=P.nigriventer tachykinin peptides III; Short=PnTkP-III; AltName: Full=U29-ctenitoxin-Pn1c; Short=U29-CNTX-Pn1c [Phoneutria nigriventer]
QKKDKKDR